MDPALLYKSYNIAEHKFMAVLVSFMSEYNLEKYYYYTKYVQV